MAERFLTDAVETLFGELKPEIQDVLEAIDAAEFDRAGDLLAPIHERIDQFRRTATDDEVLRDIFAFAKYVGVIESYRELWHRIWTADYRKSWNSLQDALDQLRLVKRFSLINVEYFENQLVELESGYPYTVFASIGAVVDRFECSICGLDIDGFECTHRRNELYGGRLAYGIARNVTMLDHVSLVSNPVDKRCVIEIENTAHRFPVLAYIHDLWKEGSFRVANLIGLERSTRRVPHPEHGTRGRNDPCYCGSGLKFKRCCIDKPLVTRDHIDLIGGRGDIRGAVV